MKRQRGTTADGRVANKTDGAQGILDALCAHLIEAKKSKAVMYGELHRFYAHFAASPDVEVYIAGTDWRCASFAEVCAREGFDLRNSVRKIRAVLVEWIFARVVLEEAAPDDTNAIAMMPLSAYECFAATIDAHTQGVDWAAWSWPALDAWIRHDDQRDLRAAMVEAWETAKRRASGTGAYRIPSSHLVEAWRDHLASRQPPSAPLPQMPTESC